METRERSSHALALFPVPDDSIKPIPYAILIAAAYGCTDQPQVTQPSLKLAEAAAVRYEIVKLPSLGGTQSRGMAINEQGWVAGWSNRADGSRRAVLWRNGSITSLGTLGGPSSTVPWPGLNEEGTVVGRSQTNREDPLASHWLRWLERWRKERCDWSLAWMSPPRCGHLPTSPA